MLGILLFVFRPLMFSQVFAKALLLFLDQFVNDGLDFIQVKAGVRERIHHECPADPSAVPLTSCTSRLAYSAIRPAICRKPTLPSSSTGP